MGNAGGPEKERGKKWRGKGGGGRSELIWNILPGGAVSVHFKKPARIRRQGLSLF